MHSRGVDATCASNVGSHWRKRVIAPVLAGMLLLVPAAPAQAHGGGLDSDGGHNCNVGSCAGTYHCHQSRGPRCGGGIKSQPLPNTPSLSRCVTLGTELTPQEVRLIQLALMADGFDPGPLDGVFGRRTSLAINAYELTYRLRLSPIRRVYYATLIHLGIAC